MDRIEEIRERLTLTTDMGGEYLVPLEIVEEDIPYLLERIDELERDNRRLRKQLEASHLDYLSTQE